MPLEAVEIASVRVHDVTQAEALSLMSHWVEEGGVHQVATVNPEFVVAAQAQPDFRHTLNRADLSLPDGVGLLWAAQLLGRPLRERVTGADTVPAIARLAAERGYGLYLLGAAPGVAEQAAAALTARYPGLRVVGTYAGSPSPDEENEIVARVRRAAPEFLFVAYGAPRQDQWIRRNIEALGVPVCIGVGGTLDYIAGVAPRAPHWLRRLGLEWLYRLVRQPWRWRRMLALPRFVVLVLGQAWGWGGR